MWWRISASSGNLHLLPWQSLLSLNGALIIVQLLYQQSEIFPDEGRSLYNEAGMSAMTIPQVLKDSCTLFLLKNKKQISIPGELLFDIE